MQLCAVVLILIFGRSGLLRCGAIWGVRGSGSCQFGEQLQLRAVEEDGVVGDER